MLILTRKVGQSITIGDGSIVVSVVEIKGRQVRLGIQAPPEMPVHRQEVFLKIQESNRQAAAASTGDVEQLARLLGQGEKDSDG